MKLLRILFVLTVIVTYPVFTLQLYRATESLGRDLMYADSDASAEKIINDIKRILARAGTSPEFQVKLTAISRIKEGMSELNFNRYATYIIYKNHLFSEASNCSDLNEDSEFQTKLKVISKIRDELNDSQFNHYLFYISEYLNFSFYEVWNCFYDSVMPTQAANPAFFF